MQPQSAREQLASVIIRRLRDAGHSAFLVGGCVRDRLLGLEPKDYDVNTSAPPEELLQLFPRAETVGAHFGVVLVHAGPGIHVEIATFRSEGSYADGRRPDAVEFEIDPARDVQRRDFTINGLMEDLQTGAVLDFVGGEQDLRAGIVRAIGDPLRRFGEDHLRMLRAVRFAARLSFQIEPQTLAAIRQLAPSVTRISAERVRDELTRMLTEGHARRAMELLDECDLLRFILPEVKAFRGVQQPPEYHPEGDVWEHVLLMLDRLSEPTPTLALGALLHDVGKPSTFRVADRIRFDGHAEVGAEMARAILKRLRFSNDDVEQIVALVANHMKFKDVTHMRPSTLKRFLCMPEFQEHLELHRLDTQASNGYTAAYDFVKAQLAAAKEEDLRPPKLLTGEDLIRAGFKPGPSFGAALHAVETAQLDGEIATREDALRLAQAVLSTSR